MSNYYSKRDAKVRIAEELIRRGWEVFGFTEDQSDSMTDYYCPAHWGGIASKNGYILVVDNRTASEGRDITKFNPNYIEMSISDRNKIKSLKNMTVEKGATVGETENAKKLIEKIQAKYNNEGVSKYEVVGRIPAYMGNSKGCIWHIEKDGALVDKGNKLTVFADMPESYIFNINTMEFNESYKNCIVWEDGERVRKERTLTEAEEKAIKEFKSFILRLERAVNGQNSCGDGTAETMAKAMEQQSAEKMKKIVVEKKKEVVNLEEVTRENELQVNDVIFVSGYGNCKVYEINEELNMYRVVKLGSKTRGYQESKSLSGKISLNKKSFDGSITRGYLKVYNLVTVEEIEKVEKWVKVKERNNKQVEQVKEEVKENTIVEAEKEKNINVTVKFNEDKNGIELYFDSKPNAELLEKIKSNGFRWSKYQKMWYAKDNQERRSFLIDLGLLQAENVEEKEEIKTSLPSETVEKIELLEIDDIKQYTISEELSKRENECHWIFRTKERNHTQELQNYLLSCKENLIEILKDTDNIIIKNKAIRYLNSHMKKYHNLFTRMIRNRAEMPSVAVAGAGGYNFRKSKKINNRYGNLLKEYTCLTDEFKSKLRDIKHNIRKEKDNKTIEKINEYKAVYSDLKLNKTIVKYNPSAVDNIFVGANTEVNTYEYKGYYILKNWGSFKIYDSNGNMLYIENIPCSCATLKDCKLFLSYIINNKVDNAA